MPRRSLGRSRAYETTHLPIAKPAKLASQPTPVILSDSSFEELESKDPLKPPSTAVEDQASAEGRGYDPLAGGGASPHPEGASTSPESVPSNHPTISRFEKGGTGAAPTHSGPSAGSGGACPAFFELRSSREYGGASRRGDAQDDRGWMLSGIGENRSPDRARTRTRD
jgi:hypothetical protein